MRAVKLALEWSVAREIFVRRLLRATGQTLDKHSEWTLEVHKELAQLQDQRRHLRHRRHLVSSPVKIIGGGQYLD